jgi:hypothetical protein
LAGIGRGAALSMNRGIAHTLTKRICHCVVGPHGQQK